MLLVANDLTTTSTGQPSDNRHDAVAKGMLFYVLCGLPVYVSTLILVLFPECFMEESAFICELVIGNGFRGFLQTTDIGLFSVKI